MSATTLPERFAAHLRTAALLPAGEVALVALSGGLDSTCLLHLLRFPLARSGLKLHAAHFDHAMRAGSAAEAAWVRGLCRAWGVPVTVARAATPPRGEAAAREARYAFLHQVAASTGATAIVTGHHADDQLETIIFRVARGTGVRGLRGIPERRGLLVRPLLPFRRRELAAYARAAGLRWREDESNAWPGFTRNRIRQLLVPALEAAWPGAAAGWLQLAEHAARIEALWQTQLPGLLAEAVVRASPGRYELARGVLRGYHPLTRARVMRTLAQRLGTPLDRIATRTAVRFAAHGASGASVALGGGLSLTREFDRLALESGSARAPGPADRTISIPAARAGAAGARLGGMAYTVRWGPQRPARAEASMSAAFDPTTLRFPLELRGWRPGDRIRLRYGTKKLKKLFGERRIPRARRDSLPVLAEQGEGGGVLWVAGVVRADVAASGSESWHITVSDGESV